MHGIITKLPEPFYSRLLKIWNDVEREFGFKGVKVMPIPHFTWNVAQKYNLKEVENIIRSLVKETGPIEIKSTGLAFFNNEMFVAYNGIHKNSVLRNLHKNICKQIIVSSEEPSQYYLPDKWIPHITMVFEEKNSITEPVKLTNFLKKLDLNWTFTLDNLAIIQQSERQSTKVISKVKLK
jgi:hypothetical protein